MLHFSNDTAERAGGWRGAEWEAARNTNCCNAGRNVRVRGHRGKERGERGRGRGEMLDVASGKIYTGCQPPNNVIALYKLWLRTREIKS